MDKIYREPKIIVGLCDGGANETYEYRDKYSESDGHSLSLENRQVDWNGRIHSRIYKGRGEGGGG